MRKSLSYIFYGVSLAGVSCRRRWPAPLLLPWQRSWASIGRQLEAVGQKFSYYYQCLCGSNIMHNPHKLNSDSNRNTKNIKIIKIAIENANLCGKKAICALCWNMWNMRQSHIRVKLTCRDHYSSAVVTSGRVHTELEVPSILVEECALFNASPTWLSAVLIAGWTHVIAWLTQVTQTSYQPSTHALHAWAVTT